MFASEDRPPVVLLQCHRTNEFKALAPLYPSARMHGYSSSPVLGSCCLPLAFPHPDAAASARSRHGVFLAVAQSARPTRAAVAGDPPAHAARRYEKARAGHPGLPPQTERVGVLARGVLARMERTGCVERYRNARDARPVHVRLIARGEACFA